MTTRSRADVVQRPVASCVSVVLAISVAVLGVGRTSANDRIPAPAPAPIQVSADGPRDGHDGPAAAVWEACAEGWECTTVTVPWDPADSSLGEVGIPVIRRPADDPGRRLGALVFNPGGPGIPGASLIQDLAPVFPAAILERFDLVSFDPRGTGDAGRVDCGTDAGALFALDQAGGPGAPAARAWESMAAACLAAHDRRLSVVSTVRTADDIERIREALGVETIDWYGMSYGTRLGLEYLRRFPDRVRTLVLDGSMDPAASLDQQARDMAAAAEPVLERLLAACGYQDPCPLGDDPLGAYDELAAQLVERPLTATDGREVGLVALQVAAQGAAALPVFVAQPFIEAVAAARDGSADALLGLAATYADATGRSTFDAQVAILCNDEAVHPDPTASAALAAELQQAAPRVGLGVATTWGVVCQGWDEAVAPVGAFEFQTSVPVLVFGSTGDPSTSYAWSERMARAVTGAHLLTRQGDGHTVLLNTFLAGCAGAALADFLIDPASATPPATCMD